MMQYDMIIALAVSVFSILGGFAFGFSYKQTDKSQLYMYGLALYGIGIVGTLLLFALFLVNLFSGIGVYAIFAMADAWIGSSMSSVVLGSIVRSILPTVVAAAGMIGGLLLAWIVKRKVTKKQ